MRRGSRWVFRAGVTVAAGVSLGAAGAALGAQFGWAEGLYRTWLLQSTTAVERAYQLQGAGEGRAALEVFRRAVEGDPGSPYRWCDYGEALLEQHEAAAARRCILRGLELGPGLGPVLMRGVNFGYRTQDAGLAVRTGIDLLGKTAAYDDAVFGTWAHMEIPVEGVLRAGLADPRSAEAYVRYLGAADRVQDAGAVWGWMRARGMGSEKSAAQYVAALLRAHEYEGATAAWGAYAREGGYPGENAIFNGSFEREPGPAALDWQFEAVKGAEAEREEGGAADGRWCLRLNFDGTENLQFRQVWQRAVVQPGANYVFSAKVRTEGITTDQGIALRVADAEDPERFTVLTDAFRGACGWTVVKVPLHVPMETHVVNVRVVRSASYRFDNKLAGTAWIDAVSLRRVR